MNNILEMIKNEKVEWKKPGDVKEVKTVSAKKKYKKQEYLDKGLYPIIDQGQDFIAGYTNDGNFLFDENSYVVFGDHTEAIKYVDFPFAQGADGIKVIKTCEEYINSKYLYHVLLNFYKITGDYKRHFSNLKELEIPIPSLETQERIVKILDTMVDHFTQLEAELEAELEARNKQYEYYRDKLLSEEYLNKLTKKFGGEIDCEELGNICKFLDYKRKPVKKSDRIPGEYPYYGANGIQDYINDYIFEGTFLLMGEDGSVMDEHNRPILHWVDNKKIWVNNHAHVLAEKNKNYNLRYIYYFLSNLNVSDIVNGLPPKINQTNLRVINILIPPIPVQKYIVSILDCFNKIVTDINEGLPKEIELRQKQYEYYRERLLDFKRDDDE